MTSRGTSYDLVAIAANSYDAPRARRGSLLGGAHPEAGEGDGDGAGRVGEEVVALVVDHDEGGEVLDLDLPDRLHPELGILQHLDRLDAVLGEPGGGAADRPEVEAAVLVARLGDLLAPVALREHHHRSASGLERFHV